MSPDDKRHGTDTGYRRKCRCAPCKAAHSAALRRRYVGGPALFLPFAPLEPYWPRIVQVTEPASSLRDAVEKARRRGRVTIRTADRIAIALGLHPGLIWSEWWLTDLEVSA